MRRLAVLASVLMLLTSVAPTVLAQGKGKGKAQKTAYSISLQMLTDGNEDGLPNHGDVVKFDVYTGGVSAFVSLSCYQGSAWVYAAGGYPADWSFTLSSNNWTAGPADCTATVYTTVDGSRTTTLGTLSFRVQG